LGVEGWGDVGFPRVDEMFEGGAEIGVLSDEIGFFADVAGEVVEELFAVGRVDEFPVAVTDGAMGLYFLWIDTTPEESANLRGGG
jgi:hypothetical protein